MRCLLRRCHECNLPLGNKDLFCPRCGAKQRREKLFCIASARAGSASVRCPLPHARDAVA